MTHHPTRTRARWALLAVVALVAAGSGLASRATTATTAAWTNDVRATTEVTLGAWSPPVPTSSCEVRDVGTDAVVAEVPCTVASAQAPNSWGGGASAGYYIWAFRLDAPGSYPAHLYLSFTVVLPSYPPAGWQTATAFVARVDNNATVTSSCAALPVVSGRLPANLGEAVTTSVMVVDRPVGGAAPLCTMP